MTQHATTGSFDPVPAAAARPLPSPAGFVRFVGVVVVGVALDLWTKYLAFDRLALGIVHLPDGVVRVIPKPPYTVIPNWLEFSVTTNQGAVFGLGQGQRALFIAVSAAAIVFLSYLFITGKRRWWYQILLGMLLAGVLGNMYDRIALGYVRDMIHALPGWPSAFRWVFNIADSLLCVGVFFMIVEYLLTANAAAPASSRPADGEPNPSR